MAVGTGKAFFWVGSTIVLLAFLPQVPGCLMANTPKVGRVIDVTTGQGMAGITVIATAHFFAQNPAHGSTRDYPYRIITQTDMQGNYRLPATWQHIRIAFPGTESREEWLVTAFKPGYAVAGDERAWMEFNKYGERKYKPRSVVDSPSGTWRGIVVQVEPIRMHPVELTLGEAAIYYRDIIGVGLNAGDSRSPEEVALRKIGYAMFQPDVCELDSNSTMDITEASSFQAYVFDNAKFIEGLRKLEPSGFQDAYRHPVFHAGNVCEAMKMGEMR